MTCIISDVTHLVLQAEAIVAKSGTLGADLEKQTAEVVRLTGALATLQKDFDKIAKDELAERTLRKKCS